MHTKRRAVAQGGSAALATGLAPGRRQAQAGSTLRVGVLTDLSGPYQNTGGPGSVECTRQAAQEAMAALPELAVEVIAGDHQNKADVGAALAQQWFDRDGVDAILKG